MGQRTPLRGSILATVVLSLAVLAVATFLAEGPQEMNDLEVFHRAGTRFLAGEPLYRAADGHFAFKYLPIAAALFVPLSFVPIGAAKIGWLTGCWLSLSAAFALGSRLARDRLPWWGPLAALVVLGRSFEREFANGQINAFLLLLLVAAFLLLDRRRDVVAGVLLAVIGLLKPPWLVLFPYLLVARRGRTATALVAVVLLGLALPAARYGLAQTLGHHRAMNALLAESTSHLLTYPTNVSLSGALAKLTGRGFPEVALLAAALLALPSAVFGWRVWVGPRDGLRDLAVLAPLAVLVSPQAWDYTVLTTLPALLFAAREARGATWMVRAVTAALASLAALDYALLFGRGASYACVMRASPSTWLLLWLLTIAAFRFDPRARDHRPFIGGDEALHRHR